MKLYNFTLSCIFATMAISLLSCSSVQVMDLNRENVNSQYRLANKQIPHFLPINSHFSDPSLKYIGKLSLEVKHQRRSTLTNAFRDIRKRASHFGANIYSIESSNCSMSIAPCEITLEIFSTSEIDRHKQVFPADNSYFVFGKMKLSDADSHTLFTFDNEQIHLKPLHFWYFHNSEYLPHVLNSGGNALGSTITLSTKPKPPMFLRAFGDNVRPGTTLTGGLAIQFSKGAFEVMDMELGLFLLQILPEQTDIKNTVLSD